MSLLELEDAIITQLGSAGLGVAVEPYPDQPSSYALIDPVGAILVVLRGSQYSPAVGGVQKRTVSVVLTLLSRSLASHGGTYTLIDAVASALGGWCPGDAWSEMTLQSDTFVDETDGVWQYDMTFTVSRRFISPYQACA